MLRQENAFRAELTKAWEAAKPDVMDAMIGELKPVLRKALEPDRSRLEQIQEYMPRPSGDRRRGGQNWRPGNI